MPQDNETPRRPSTPPNSFLARQPFDDGPGAHQRAGGDVAVPVQILRRGVHDQIHAERQRLLIHRTGKGVVED